MPMAAAAVAAGAGSGFGGGTGDGAGGVTSAPLEGPAVSFFGVSDGVGDWHRMRVNPSAYSTALMRGAERAVREAATLAGPAMLLQAGHGGEGSGGPASGHAQPGEQQHAKKKKRRKRGRPSKLEKAREEEEARAAALAQVPQRAAPSIPGPIEVLRYAWQYAAEQATVGSATACVLTVDPLRSQLVAANLGDSGFIVVRPRRVSNMGSLGTADAPQGSLGLGADGSGPGGATLGSASDDEAQLEPDSDGELPGFELSQQAQYDPKRAEFERNREIARRRAAAARRALSVVFRSPQQLRGFNFPYQLGHCPAPPEEEDEERGGT